jgi:hypothetical protein
MLKDSMKKQIFFCSDSLMTLKLSIYLFLNLAINNIITRFLFISYFILYDAIHAKFQMISIIKP